MTPTLRPPGLGSQVVPTAPSLLVDEPAISVTRATTAGGDRPLDLDEFNIGNAEDAEAALQGWNQLYDIYGPPAVPGIAVNSLSGVIAQVRNESTLLDRVSVSSAVPLIVLALLMLYVLGAAAAEARRPEVALAKLRGHSRPRIALFALSESLAVLMLAVPAGALAGVAANRVMTRLWLGSTPLVITPQAWTALGAVALAAVVATAVAVVGVVREPVNDSLTVATRRRVASKLTLLLRGGLVAVAVAAVVQIRSRDVTSSSSYLELLTPLFVGLAASVLAVPLVVGLSRLWTRRTATRGGTTPFLASRRLSRRRDAATLVLPFLLATTITVFAFSAWRVADDWRVSRAAADVGAATAYVTDTPPDQLLRITHAVDPDGRYLAAAVPAASRTQDGARVALVDASRFASVAAWDDSWGAGPAQVQEWLTAPTSLDPITFTGSHVTVDLADIRLEGDLNLPLALGLRYTAGDTGRETVVQLGDVPLRGTAHLRAGTPGCDETCTVEQIYLSGSSDSVTDAQGSLRIQAIAADGADPGDWRLDDATAWRPARPYGTKDNPPTLDAGAGGLQVTTPKNDTSIIRLTTADVPEAPPLVLTGGSVAEQDGTGLVSGASLLGQRTPMQLTGRAGSLPLVGTSGGLSDLGSALREYGDQVGDVPLTQLLVAPGHARLGPARRRGRRRPAGHPAQRGRGARQAAHRPVLGGLEGLPVRGPGQPGAGVPRAGRDGAGAAALAGLRGRGAARGRRTPPGAAPGRRHRVRRAAGHGRARRCRQRRAVAVAAAAVHGPRCCDGVRAGPGLRAALGRHRPGRRVGDRGRGAARAVDRLAHHRAGNAGPPAPGRPRLTQAVVSSDE